MKVSLLLEAVLKLRSFTKVPCSRRTLRRVSASTALRKLRCVSQEYLTRACWVESMQVSTGQHARSPCTACHSCLMQIHNSFLVVNCPGMGIPRRGTGFRTNQALPRLSLITDPSGVGPSLSVLDLRACSIECRGSCGSWLASIESGIIRYRR